MVGLRGRQDRGNPAIPKLHASSKEKRMSSSKPNTDLLILDLQFHTIHFT